jgi:hypothetical protein
MSHEHTWIREFRHVDPACEVYGCNCGVRRRVYPGMGGVPDIVDETPDPRGAEYNCLIKLDPDRGFASLLGDPQGERMKLLLGEAHN